MNIPINTLYKHLLTKIKNALLAIQFVYASDGASTGYFFEGSDVIRILQWHAQYLFRTYGLCVQKTRGRRTAPVIHKPYPHATNPRQPPGRPHTAVNFNRHASTVRNQNEK